MSKIIHSIFALSSDGHLFAEGATVAEDHVTGSGNTGADS